MFPWLEVCRSANESVGDSEALAGESTEATSPAPESGQETQDENTQSVPVKRFKAVNDKLVNALKKITEMEALGNEESVPAPKAPTATVDMASIQSALKDTLNELGVPALAEEVKQMKVLQKRTELLAVLRNQFPQFNEERDRPRIVAKMEAAKKNGETIGAIRAFKELMTEGPLDKAPVAHDAQGNPTGDDKPGRGKTPSGFGALKREGEATAKFKRMFDRDPKMRRALELDD